jgi:hypothetical protein
MDLLIEHTLIVLALFLPFVTLGEDRARSQESRTPEQSSVALMFVGIGFPARYMVSPTANMGKPPLPAFVPQLEEARAEWWKEM